MCECVHLRASVYVHVTMCIRFYERGRVSRRGGVMGRVGESVCVCAFVHKCV